MQGYAKQRSYIFVYTWPSINGCGLSVFRDVVVNAREFSVPYESRLAVMLYTRCAIERLTYNAHRPPGSYDANLVGNAFVIHYLRCGGPRMSSALSPTEPD